MPGPGQDPTHLAGIGPGAFYGCRSLDRVVVPESVREIGDSAFDYCGSLTSVQLPMQLGEVRASTFRDCTRLALIALPPTVTNIAESAFSGCTNLTRVVISESAQYLGDQAFAACTRLATVYCTGPPPEVGPAVFYNAPVAVVHYLEGIAGWQDRFAGLPTLAWMPALRLANSTDAGPGGFRFTSMSAQEMVVVQEACSDLTHPLWVPVATNWLQSTTTPFTDPAWTNHARRFYRLRLP